ncbi:hypothetical protein I7I48_00404 [Histoplasma ohiense]|nr:hypothetical protein I7I48_00404 [Histoplasma ohiense (nom. inval.)]
MCVLCPSRIQRRNVLGMCLPMYALSLLPALSPLSPLPLRIPVTSWATSQRNRNRVNEPAGKPLGFFFFYSLSPM